jgi:hypothetical protein
MIICLLPAGILWEAKIPIVKNRKVNLENGSVTRLLVVAMFAEFDNILNIF